MFEEKELGRRGLKSERERRRRQRAHLTEKAPVMDPVKCLKRRKHAYMNRDGGLWGKARNGSPTYVSAANQGVVFCGESEAKYWHMSLWRYSPI